MLEVKNLSVDYSIEDKQVKAVKNFSLTVEAGEIVGLVGESGSGKSTIAHAILRLISPPGKIITGEILFNNQDLLKLSEPEMIKVRGAKISMIFQDPFSSLNPVFKIGDQIAEVIELHQGLGRQAAWHKAVEMLDLVQIKEPAKRVNDYPHQFSGGMRQRAMIAMALACQPELLIADEPTTALDVTIQVEILKLIQELQRQLKISVVYITHNFGIIKALCSRVVVIYQGKKVEAGKVEQVLANPQNDYTRRLIGALKVLRH